MSDTTLPYTYTEIKTQIGNTAESDESFGGPQAGDGNGTKPMKNMDSNNILDFTNGTKELKKGDFGGPNGNNIGTDNSMGNNENSSSSLATTGTVYQTAQDYINSLNSDKEWIKYDENTNTVKITSIRDFVTHCKNAQKKVGAFDSVDASQGENNLFGNGQDESKHFDNIEAELIKANQEKYSSYSDWKDEYVSSYETDLASKDSLGVDMQTRVNMYNPMYYLLDYYGGKGTSTVAKYWRIRTGINQTDTALTTEENLKNCTEHW